MKTIVIKGSNLSFNDKKLLRSVQEPTISVVLVYPTGVIETINTNRYELDLVIDGDESTIIYK